MKTLFHARNGSEGAEGQPLDLHLRNVADLAAEFAGAFGAREWGYAAGLLHDLGKYSPEFQRRLAGAPIKVDHSTAGAVAAGELIAQKGLARLLAYVVAGHHAGLPDGGSAADLDSLRGRLERWDKKPAFMEQFRPGGECAGLFPNLAALPFRLSGERGARGFSLSFLARMIFSCLVDADRLDSERFGDPGAASLRAPVAGVAELAARLEGHLDKTFGHVSQTPVNRLRAAVLARCAGEAARKPGLFTLTVPTGGGKTLASLAFALRHAEAHGLSRVVYVIPYTTIIEQNAAIFREALGNESVIEHHSAVDAEKALGVGAARTDCPSESARRHELAAENWDAPVVVTTNVQFFESLFAARSSRCRKVHNLARSVIVLDEAQLLPPEFLKPCLFALSELVSRYGASVVLCTATQPALAGLFPHETPASVELAPSPEDLYARLRRARVAALGNLDDASLAERMKAHRQVLLVVNTRRHARMVYGLMADAGNAFHLSAAMYPAHRLSVLDRVRACLERREPCRVVSTQLVEAGVDIDFPVVYRAMAGLDSIAQAAGRCNRHGTLPAGEVFVFDPERHGRAGGWLDFTAQVGRGVLERHGADPLSLEAVHEYFSLLFGIEGEGLDKKRILERLGETAREALFPFREIERDFNIINEDSRAVVIPREEEAEALLRRLRFAGPSREVLRGLQRHAVQIRKGLFKRLLEAGDVTPLGEFVFVLSNLRLYDAHTGLHGPDDEPPNPSGFIV